MGFFSKWFVTCSSNHQVGLLDRLGHKPDPQAVDKVQTFIARGHSPPLLVLGPLSSLEKLDMDEFSEMS